MFEYVRRFIVCFKFGSRITLMWYMKVLYVVYITYLVFILKHSSGNFISTLVAKLLVFVNSCFNN